MGIGNEKKDKKNPPESLLIIERKGELKLLGVTFRENPWDTRFHNTMAKVYSRLYILRT